MKMLVRNRKPVSQQIRMRPTGVVLPIVLVILTVLTGLVVTQIRRSTIDERLAANTRETIVLDSAAQTVLRWCEERIIQFPNDTAVIPVDIDLAVPPPAPFLPTSAVWDDDANTLNFSGVNLLTGVTQTGPDQHASCVIEEATPELRGFMGETGMVHGGVHGINDRWRKYRITARVRTPAPDFGGFRAAFAQSEIRLFLD